MGEKEEHKVKIFDKVKYKPLFEDKNSEKKTNFARFNDNFIKISFVRSTYYIHSSKLNSKNG
jgi:hypothetical protein